jgi:hypothetical protein
MTGGAQARHDPTLDDLHRRLRLGLVLRMEGRAERYGRAVDSGHQRERTVRRSNVFR